MQTKELVEGCTNWIKHWFKENGDENTKAVVAISGGKDSTVVAKLLCEAIGKDRVIGVMIPNENQVDIADSERVIKTLGIKGYTINIGPAYASITEAMRPVFPDGSGAFPPDAYMSNTPARLRNAVTYGVASVIGNCRVVNTCNRSEEIVGYSTLYGDLSGDFAPIELLTVDEVVRIGDYLKLPKDLVHKVPSDGMSLNADGTLKSDEDKLGISYDVIDKVVRNRNKGVSDEDRKKVIEKFEKNMFKLSLIKIPSYVPLEPDYFIDHYGL